MYLDDLDKENIEEVKELYEEYLLANKKEQYASNLMSFEEYLQEEIVMCALCKTPTTRDRYDISRDGYLCECCYDDLYYKEEEDEYDKYVDYKLEGGE